jgi:hypothetical protein
MTFIGKHKFLSSGYSLQLYGGGDGGGLSKFSTDHSAVYGGGHAKMAVLEYTHV